jgi:general stress protein 26
MAHEEQTNKATDELVERAWKIASDAGTAILFTVDGDEQSARPMSATVRREEDAIYFLTAADSVKVRATKDQPSVTVFFSDGTTKHVSFVGEAQVSNDRAKIKELWTPFAKAWWDSAEDPRIRLLTVNPTAAEIWDGPNKLTTGALMLTAVITGSKPKIGDHAKLRL